MAEFRKPSRSARENDAGDNKLKLTGSKGSQVVSPYDGVINLASSGNVIIKHTIEGKILYSHIEGLGTIYVAKNQKVNSGETIGTFGDNPIIFYLFDGSKNLKTKNYIGVEFDKNNNSSGNKEEKKPNTTTQDEFQRKDYGEFKLTSGLSPLHQMWADFNAIPLKALKSGMDNIFPEKPPFNKKEWVERAQKLIEEIERIKSLLK